MPRYRRVHRLHGRYRLHRIRNQEFDEEDGNETVIEYSTGTDSDDEDIEEVPRRRGDKKPRGWWCCRRVGSDDLWRAVRDLLIVAVILWWLLQNLSDPQKERLSTWQKWWHSNAVPVVSNITTEGVASLRRFHSHRAPKSDPVGYFQSTNTKPSTFPVA